MIWESIAAPEEQGRPWGQLAEGDPNCRGRWQLIRRSGGYTCLPPLHLTLHLTLHAMSHHAVRVSKLVAAVVAGDLLNGLRADSLSR